MDGDAPGDELGAVDGNALGDLLGAFDGVAVGKGVGARVGGKNCSFQADLYGIVKLSFETAGYPQPL